MSDLGPRAITRADLQQLAQMRSDDAIFLLRNSRWSSAYYIAGYAVELGLKACIAKSFLPDVIPDSKFVEKIFTHSFTDLVGVAGLLVELKKEFTADPQFEINWGISTKWNEGDRYKFWDSIAATQLVEAIVEPSHGAFQWVKKHW